MQLSFLDGHFPGCSIEHFEKDGSEWVYIRHPDYEEPIKVDYTDEVDTPYLMRFATQHLHLETQEEVLAHAQAFATGQQAAVEFYHNDRPCFGGDEDVAFIVDASYDDWLRRFHVVLNTKHTFRCYGWHPDAMVSGRFERDAQRKWQVVLERNIR